MLACSMLLIAVATAQNSIPPPSPSPPPPIVFPPSPPAAPPLPPFAPTSYQTSSVIVASEAVEYFTQSVLNGICSTMVRVVAHDKHTARRLDLCAAPRPHRTRPRARAGPQVAQLSTAPESCVASVVTGSSVVTVDMTVASAAAQTAAITQLQAALATAAAASTLLSLTVQSVPAVQATGVFCQWATSATASTQYSSSCTAGSQHACAATGAPDLTGCGDLAGAWYARSCSEHHAPRTSLAPQTRVSGLFNPSACTGARAPPAATPNGCSSDTPNTCSSLTSTSTRHTGRSS
jgi:hypothetical protein